MSIRCLGFDVPILDGSPRVIRALYHLEKSIMSLRRFVYDVPILDRFSKLVERYTIGKL